MSSRFQTFNAGLVRGGIISLINIIFIVMFLWFIVILSL